MVGTIAPLVQGQRRQWGISTGVFIVASVASGVGASALLGSVGQIAFGGLPRPLLLRLLAGFAVFLALVDLSILPFRVPTLYQSVPQHWWTRYGPTRAALLYGGILALGVTTFIPVASFYFLPAAALSLGPLIGGVIGGSYALGRAIAVPIASLTMACGIPPSTIGVWVVGDGPRRRGARIACGMALLTLAVWCLG